MTVTPDTDPVDDHEDPVDDHELAAVLAERSGVLLLELRDGHPDMDGRELGKLGDRHSDDHLQRELARLRPDDAVLSEETADELDRRLGADRVWIIDPLDGTREYGERRVDVAVHVALWDRRDGGHLVAAAVSLPALGVTLRSDRPGPLPPRASVTRIAVSRTRPPAWIGDVAGHVGAVLEPLGSVGYKISSILRGETDAYVHTGAMSEWDSAAPVAVAVAAGLHASRLDGSPLVFNQPEPRTMDILVCRPEIADDLRAILPAPNGPGDLIPDPGSTP